MRYLIALWAIPLALFWGWYFLSLNDMTFGYLMLSRRLHDFVFQGTHLRCQASVNSGSRELVLRLAADNTVKPETTVDLWVQSRDVILINREGV